MNIELKKKTLFYNDCVLFRVTAYFSGVNYCYAAFFIISYVRQLTEDTFLLLLGVSQWICLLYTGGPISQTTHVTGVVCQPTFPSPW